VPFTPEELAALRSSPVAAFAPFLLCFTDVLWTPGTWPWSLTREAALTLLGQPKYTAQELQRWLADPNMGPLGDWASAALLARLDASVSEQFIQAARGKLNPDLFNRDLDALLRPGSAGGEALAYTLKALRDFSDAQAQGVFNLAEGPVRAAALDFMAALRSHSNQPAAALLKPVVVKHWDALLQPYLQTQLATLARQVGTPRNAEDAMARAGFIFRNAKSADEAKEAVPLVRYAAEKEQPDAMLALAQFYLDGELVRADTATALEWLTKAEALGVPHAGCRMGDVYLNGKGVEADPAKAAEHYRRDGERGCGRSQYMLGNIAEKQRQLPEALDWYRRASTNHFALAQTTLADYLNDDLFSKPDYAEAFLWYRAAALQGDRVAAASARVLEKKLTPDQVRAANDEAWRLSPPERVRKK
jgi:hypothetical protein